MDSHHQETLGHLSHEIHTDWNPRNFLATSSALEVTMWHISCSATHATQIARIRVGVGRGGAGDMEKHLAVRDLSRQGGAAAS